jgi:PDZ domain
MSRLRQFSRRSGAQRALWCISIATGWFALWIGAVDAEEKPAPPAAAGVPRQYFPVRPGDRPPSINVYDAAGLVNLGALDLVPAGPPRPNEKLSVFWIGLTGNPVDDLLRTHLVLPEGQGLVVTKVVEGSPSARAGIQVNDVLVAGNDKGIKGIEDLAGIVDSGKEAKITMRLIRAGKPILVEITPERRPPAQTGETCPAISRLEDAEFLRRLWADLLEKSPDEDQLRTFLDDKSPDKRTQQAHKLLRESKVANRSCATCHTVDAESVRLLGRLVDPKGSPLEAAAHPMWRWGNNYYSAQPGAVFVHYNSMKMPRMGTMGMPPEFPADLEVTIVRKGNEPARVTAKRGDKTWQATEKDYAETLPADILPHVESMLSGRSSAGSVHLHNLPLGWKVRSLPFRSSNLNLREGTAATPPSEPNAKLSAEEQVGNLIQQFESLGRQMDDLRKSLQELQQSVPKKSAPPEDGK